VQTIDWTGGQIGDNDSAEDIKHVDLTCVHHLSGPIAVNDKEGKPAMPGDLLVVEICNLGALPGDEWGESSPLVFLSAESTLSSLFAAPSLFLRQEGQNYHAGGGGGQWMGVVEICN